ncbi:MAG: general secretion pathway protein GspE [Betaproteobacteria bacterium RIFCSPLOWO2_12_FULL_62_13]|nr:MAG: general secretion pathway protein GspE [Betaproteobacteria bacterium RIFCSPLOWO2_12_FULL_62_13]
MNEVAIPERAFLTDADLIRARQEAARSRHRLIDVLQEQLALAPGQFTQVLGAALGFPVLTMQRLHALAPAFDVLPFQEAAAHECIAFRDEAGELLVAIADPFALELQTWAQGRIGVPFAFWLAHRDDIAAYLVRVEEGMRAMDGVSAIENERRADRAVEDLSLRAISEEASPVVKLVNSTLYDALKINASDIHLESTGGGLGIKYRIDGVLTQVGTVESADTAEQVISRVKVIAELDIAERRIPQDGRFKVRVKGREVDFRVSIMPSIFGEDAVLRILDKQALADEFKGLRLEALGFDPPTMAWLRKLANEPHGMLLVTGPTGSGKTTTLYALLSEIHSGRDKIVTIEDPVEYQIAGVLQIPVNEKKGLTFARGLRSILRHDPDRIMVGEIRDPETAQIAVQSALTGHLVFTTVHANNVFDVIGRFLHMGLDGYSFVAALNGVMAQRLVRLNCPHCTVDVEPDMQLVADSGLTREAVRGFAFRAGRGCGQCRGSGYRGRTAIAETMLLNDELRELISSRQPIRMIKEAAHRLGTRDLREAALELVRRGRTTLAEINRVTFVA